jgi:protein-tyrosine phosphatase
VTGNTPVRDLDASPAKPFAQESDSSSKLNRAGFEAIVLPSPASHALLYAPRTSRSLSAHIQNFLAANVDHRLNLGWQLQYLTREGKWDVKNLEKWQAVEPVSLPIANFFRALKTLREVDESHTPKVFVKDWAFEGSEEGEIRNGKDGLGSIFAVVDITHESPVYDYRGLEAGGIAYRKFPTVSKFPPTEEEVKLFIKVVDGLRAELLSGSTAGNAQDHRLIAVHCHYGFNRTGFFIIAYMVERLGWHLKEAIKEFGEKRPPGVRHAHFVDELYARYWTTDDRRS